MAPVGLLMRRTTDKGKREQQGDEIIPKAITDQKQELRERIGELGPDTDLMIRLAQRYRSQACSACRTSPSSKNFSFWQNRPSPIKAKRRSFCSAGSICS